MKYYSFFTFLSFLFVFTALSAQEPLPKGLTEEEKKVYEEFIRTYEYGVRTAPPAEPPRAPAEFEEAGGVIISWASYTSELREIARHARKRVTVYIITNDPSEVESSLEDGGVPLDNIFFVDIPYNSVWVRDYGPQSVYLDDDDELAFIDWVYNRPHRPDDNLVPVNMAGYLDVPFYQMTAEPNRLVHTGGNLMVDGHGTAFSSELVLAENASLTEEQIDDIMYDFMGIDNYIKMDELPYDNISHLDMHMKLLDEETLLVGEFPEGVSDGPYIEANLQYLLDNYQTAYGREFNVIRIPMVPSPAGNYPPNAHYRTYTNSLILNDLVLVPQYHDATLNAEALSIYEEAMPGYEIVGINMESVIGASGAIHCITREIAATDPIFITHAPVLEAEVNETISIEAEIQNVAGISEASVFWSTDGGDSFQYEDLVFDGEQYVADIAGQPGNTEVSYYISATNNNNKTITKPLVAPDGTYNFVVGDYIIGDVNGDGVINVQDLVMLVNYIIDPDNPHPDFVEENADVTGDGVIEVADVVALTNLILERTNETSDPMVSNTAEIYIENNEVCLFSDGTLAGLQFQMIVDDAGELELKLLPQDLRFVYNVRGDTINGVIYSFDNISFKENETRLLKIENLESDLKWGNVLAANIEAQSVEVETMDFTTHTGGPDYNALNFKVFPNPNKGKFSLGFELTNQANITVRMFDLYGREVLDIPLKSYNAGYNQIEINRTVDFPAGVYIIEIIGYDNNDSVLMKGETKVLIK